MDTASETPLPDHSTRMSLALMTDSHLPKSVFRISANCSGVDVRPHRPVPSAPLSPSRMIFTISACNLAMIVGGVPAGPARPKSEDVDVGQIGSVALGTSGIAAQRFCPSPSRRGSSPSDQTGG
jgi:hypothetical protein